MISRHWKGIARVEEADHYIRHLREDTFPQLAQIDGFIEATILKRTVEQGVEFLIVTVWDSMDAIKRFAGESVDVAVVPTVVQAMMVTFDTHVLHYGVEPDDDDRL